jgi:hypothetical protein
MGESDLYVPHLTTPARRVNLVSKIPVRYPFSVSKSWSGRVCLRDSNDLREFLTTREVVDELDKRINTNGINRKSGYHEIDNEVVVISVILTISGQGTGRTRLGRSIY